MDVRRLDGEVDVDHRGVVVAVILEHVERESGVELEVRRGVQVAGDRFDELGYPWTFDLVTVRLVLGPLNIISASD